MSLGRMRKLSRVGTDALARAQSAIEQRMGRYTRTREEIRQETEKRQEPWRRMTDPTPPRGKPRAACWKAGRASTDTNEDSFTQGQVSGGTDGV
jgi:hypothetical protein